MVSVPPPLLPNPERSITEDDPPAGVLKAVAVPPVVVMVMLPPGFGLVPPLALSSPLEVKLPALMVTVLDPARKWPVAVIVRLRESTSKLQTEPGGEGTTVTVPSIVQLVAPQHEARSANVQAAGT